jgi:Right handed beta helix region
MSGLKTIFAALAVVCGVGAPAHAQVVQASRTWVSGTGDDAAVCSRTAPCKTFAAAIAVTVPNGEINCLDAAGYGTLTIQQSVTIDCTGTFGSILAGSGVAGITINIPSGGTDTLRTVRLRGLSISGAGNNTRAGTRGISIVAAAAVFLEDLVISDFAQQGIADVRTSAGKTFIRNSVIRNNAGVGILATSTGSITRTSIENVHSSFNLYGIAAATSNHVSITRSVFAGNSQAGIEADNGGFMSVESTLVHANTTGVAAAGSIRLSNSDIVLNSTGISGAPTSYGNNRINDNGADGNTPTLIGATSSEHGLK